MGAIIHTGKQRIKHIGIEIDGIGHQPPDRQEQITSAKLLMTPTAWLRYGSGGGARGGGGTSPWLGRDRCRSVLPLSAVLGPRRAARRDSRIWVNTEQGTVGLFCLSEQGTSFQTQAPTELCRRKTIRTQVEMKQSEPQGHAQIKGIGSMSQAVDE